MAKDRCWYQNKEVKAKSRCIQVRGEVNVIAMVIRLAEVDALFRTLGALTSVETRLDDVNSACRSSRRSAVTFSMLRVAASAAGRGVAHVFGDVAAAIKSTLGAQNLGCTLTRRIRSFHGLGDGYRGEHAAAAYRLIADQQLDYAKYLGVVGRGIDLASASLATTGESGPATKRTTRSLTTLFENFGGSLRGHAQQFAGPGARYAFGGIRQFECILSNVVSPAYSVGMSIWDTPHAFRSIGALRAGGSSRVSNRALSKALTDNGLMLHERAQAERLDWAAPHGVIVNAFEKLKPIQLVQGFKALAFGEFRPRGVILMNELGRLEKVSADPGDSRGMETAAVATRTVAFDQQSVIGRTKLDIPSHTLDLRYLPRLEVVARDQPRLAGSVLANTSRGISGCMVEPIGEAAVRRLRLVLAAAIWGAPTAAMLQRAATAPAISGPRLITPAGTPAVTLVRRVKIGAPAIIINLRYSPTINGATEEGWSGQKHAKEIVRILRDKLNREARLLFE